MVAARCAGRAAAASPTKPSRIATAMDVASVCRRDLEQQGAQQARE